MLQGTFDRHHFEDVCRSLQRRSGVLSIELEDTTLRLHLEQCHIRSAFLQGRFVTDEALLRELYAALLTQPRGRFVFEEMPASCLRGGARLPIKQLLQELSPQPVQCDVSMPGYQQPLALCGADALAEGDQALAALLGRERGASAAELAQELGISMIQARLQLFRLLQQGAVLPLRSLEEGGTPLPLPQLCPHVRRAQGWLSRLGSLLAPRRLA